MINIKHYGAGNEDGLPTLRKEHCKDIAFGRAVTHGLLEAAAYDPMDAVEMGFCVFYVVL